MPLNNKNILVTGSTGLIGSWLVEKLINNSNVSGIAINKEMDFLLESKGILDSFNNIYIDISQHKDLRKIFQINDFDLVIHLAAQTQVVDSISEPLRTFKSNIEGTWNILELCREFSIPVVIASSDKAYGHSETLPYTEDHSLNAIYPYEVSKAIGDKISGTYINTYNLKVVTLRCGNVYGGGDLNWDRLIPGVVKSLLKEETPVLRSSGDFTRDWVYVEDVVNAYLKVSEELIKGDQEISSFYNFSSTEYFSVMEIYKELCSQISSKYIEPKFELNSDYEIKDQKLDSRKIYDELGIKSYETISSGLQKTIKWYKENNRIYE